MIRWCGEVGSSSSTSDAHRVNIKRHEHYNEMGIRVGAFTGVGELVPNAYFKNISLR